MPRPSPEEFERLVHEHHAAVYRSASRVCGDVSEAADVTQDVFVRLLRGKIRLDLANSARSVLCWTATRLAANRNRSRRCRERHEESAMREPIRSPEDPALTVADADQLRLVVALVAELPRDLRLPVQLRCQDELTFAAIGSALSISESTAHERYRAGIDRLRDRLRDRGAAVPSMALPVLLAKTPMLEVPPGLERDLLALAASSSAAPLALVRSPLGAALVAVGVTAITAIAVAIRGSDASSFNPAEVAPSVASDVASLPSMPQDAPLVRRLVSPPHASLAILEVGQDPARERPERSIFYGTVHDAGGFPVGLARVQAVAGGGLKPFELGSTTTDAAGAFRLEVGRGVLGGMVEFAKLRVYEGVALLMTTGDFALPRNESADAVDLVLPASVGTAATRYRLDITVRGPNGSPLAKVPVTLYPAVGARPRFRGGRGEAEATTDARGVARLEGRLPGDKWLLVDGRAQGCTASFETFSIPEPGEVRHDVELEVGALLRVVARPPEGGAVDYLTVWLEDENGLRFAPVSDSGGEFTFEGLSDATYTLCSAGFPWSAVRRGGVRPSELPQVVDLKRADDPRDVGDHMAEVHGHLVDARTGDVVLWDGLEVECEPARAGESTLPSDLVDPPRPVQTEVGTRKRKDFHETGLAPGRHVFLLRVKGYAATAFEVDVGPNEVIPALEIPLSRGATVRGRVVDRDGKPVAGARIFPAGVGSASDANLRRIEGERLLPRDRRWPCRLLLSTVSQEDGTFSLPGVPVGIPLRLVAVARGYRIGVQAPNMLRPGGEGRLELRLQKR